MTFSSFRSKARWPALISAFILFSLDMYCRRNCYRIIIGSGVNGPVPFKIDSTPRGFMFVWLLSLLTTLAFGVIALPRWQSFVALFTVGLVIFLSVGSDWPHLNGFINLVIVDGGRWR